MTDHTDNRTWTARRAVNTEDVADYWRERDADELAHRDRYGDVDAAVAFGVSEAQIAAALEGWTPPPDAGYYRIAEQRDLF